MIHSPARLPELDGLRGFAILLILVGHYFAAIALPEAGSPWVYFIVACRFTWTGVDLFFVLSGYLIGSILLENREATNFYRVFYLRRICRIFPLYYLNLIVFFILLYVGGEKLSPWLFSNAMPFWSYFTFTQNFVSLYWVAYLGFPAFGLGVTWSLAIEEQFYAVMPYLVRHLSRRSLLVFAFMVIALALALRCVIYPSFAIGAIINYVLLFTRADALMLGVLVAIVFATPTWSQSLQQKIKLVYLVAALSGIGLLVVNVLRQELALSESRLMSTVGYTWVGIFYACVLTIMLARPTSLLPRIFRNPLLQWFGLISYGIYLIHIPVLGLCHAWLLRSTPKISNSTETWVTMLALAITLVIAQLSWKFFERPIVKWGRNFSYKREARDVVETCNPAR